MMGFYEILDFTKYEYYEYTNDGALRNTGLYEIRILRIYE